MSLYKKFLCKTKKRTDFQTEIGYFLFNHMLIKITITCAAACGITDHRSSAFISFQQTRLPSFFFAAVESVYRNDNLGLPELLPQH